MANPKISFVRYAGSASSSFVRFQSTCACSDDGLDRDEVVDTVFRAASGFGKALLVGGCEIGEEWVVRRVVEDLAKRGIECIWLNWSNRLTQEFIVRFGVLVNHDPQTWEEAVTQNILTRQLSQVLERVRDIEDKIRHEQGILRHFPFVCKVHSISWEPDRLLQHLCGLNKDYQVQANTILAVNLSEGRGILVSKSLDIDQTPIVLLDPEDDSEFLQLELLEGRMKTKVGGLHIRISSGRWMVKEHPSLDLSEPDLRYIPMWQRVSHAS